MTAAIGKVLGGVATAVLGVVMVVNFATHTLGVRVDDLDVESRGLCEAAARVANQVNDSKDGEAATAMRLMADGTSELTTALGKAPNAQAEIRSAVSNMASAMREVSSAILYRDKSRFDANVIAAEASTDALRDRC